MNSQVNIRYVILILSLLVTHTAGAKESDPKAFIVGSFAEIKAAKTGKPFVLALWSLDCPPCLTELKLWSRLLTRYPEVDVVLISTDGMDARPAINKLLQETMQEAVSQRLESWVFADEFIERLRYEIDPQWYGELPRTIFFAHDHSRLGVSGLLKQQYIEQWIHRQSQ